jgi:hypothetical protein
MTSEKLREVLVLYDDRLSEMLLQGKHLEWLTHLHGMIPQMKQMREQHDVLMHTTTLDIFAARDSADKLFEKLMRWLGFMQGVLWAHHVYSLDELDELKSHNRRVAEEVPVGEVVRP